MPTLENPLRRLVPTQAARRLGDRQRLVLLSLRDMLRGLEDEGSVLLVAVVEFPFILAPMLRAVRDADAALGIEPPGAMAGPRALHEFFEGVCETAERVGCVRPLFLSAPAVTIASEADADLAGEQVFRWIDAGYTHVPLDASRLSVREAPGAIARAAVALEENETGLEVLLAPGQEETAGELAAALKLSSLSLDVVGIVGGDGAGMAVIAGEVDPVGVSWREGHEQEDFRGGLRNAVGAGAVMLSLRSPFTRAALKGLPNELVDPILDGNDDKWAAAKELTAAVDALDSEERDRMELGIYTCVDETLRMLRLNRAARRIRDHLFPDE